MASGARGGLEALAALAREVGAAPLADEALALAARLHEGRFFVACVGQFKRGKSTLLNALVGRPVLPVGVVPVTSAITVLRHGPQPRGRATFADGRQQEVALERVAELVAEAENPGNAKGVAAVELFLDTDLLATGMCLVDTPGIGSVFEGNTAVTRAFVPHVDAALVVLGADPPISGDELALVEDVGARTGELVLVLNKADRVTAAEMAEARRFVLELFARRLGRAAVATFEVSATEALAGGATRDWTGLQRHLRGLAEGQGAHLVEAAGARGLARLGAQLQADIAAQLDALARPLAESEQRLAELERVIADADRAVGALAPLFGAEAQRLASAFEAQRRAFLDRAGPEARQALRDALAQEPSDRPRPAAYELAQRVARAELERFRAEFQPGAEAGYRQVTARFVDLANDFLRRARLSEARLDALPPELDPEAGFRAPSHFFFTELLTLTAVRPHQWLADRARSPAQRGRAALAAADPYLRRLLDTNSARVVNDALERVRESGRALEAELRRTLERLVERSRRAIALAKREVAQGESAIQAKTTALRSARQRLVEDRLE
jgi:hypothetical protein